MERDRSMELTYGRVYGMNRTMSFLPELKDFLKANGIIYTVRKYKMLDATVEVEGIGKCHRYPMGEIESKEDLLPYLEFSGFKEVKDWWAKIKHFIPNNNDPKYLYKVLVNIIQEGDHKWVSQ